MKNNEKIDSYWRYRKEITIDHTKAAGDLSDFPFLIYLSNDADLAANARIDGFDILFTKSDGATRLNHELEYYNPATGELIAWVNIENLSSSVDTIIYIYYGNPFSSDQSNKQAVWDSNYQGVWHLQESASDEGSSTLHNDSTLNAHHGTQHGNQSYTGKIGNSQLFDGTNDAVVDYITLGTFDPTPSDLTISMWIKWSGTNGAHQIFLSKLDTWNINDMRWQLARNATAYLEFQSAGSNAPFTADLPGTGNWYYLNVTKAGTLCTLYINGSPTGVTVDMTFSNDVLSQVYIGGLSVAPQSFNGAIDEVRISDIPRSLPWIQTSYNNQNNPSGSISVALQEDVNY